MSKSFVDRFNDEDIRDQFWTLNKKICAGLIIIFLGMIMINTTGCTQNSGEDITSIETPPAELPKDSVNVGNDGVNAAIAPDEVSIIPDKTDVNSDMVSVSVESVGRQDPFLPFNERTVAKPKPKMGYDLLPPPETISVDSTALEVMATKVSGIMFDKINPSAILNISGADYLVRSGDIINGYKVLSIGKDIVTVQFGENVYKAGVGELLTGEGVNYNTVSNLESKFGGRKNLVNKK